MRSAILLAFLLAVTLLAILGAQAIDTTLH